MNYSISKEINFYNIDYKEPIVWGQESYVMKIFEGKYVGLWET